MAAAPVIQYVNYGGQIARNCTGGESSVGSGGTPALVVFAEAVGGKGLLSHEVAAAGGAVVSPVRRHVLVQYPPARPMQYYWESETCVTDLGRAWGSRGAQTSRSLLKVAVQTGDWSSVGLGVSARSFASVWLEDSAEWHLAAGKDLGGSAGNAVRRGVLADAGRAHTCQWCRWGRWRRF